ncbi:MULTISPECIES: Fic family protein [Bacteroides]|uniref:Fic family protein n=1 Tax=Bacteroides TaxID=816 RepID=UPI001899C3D7|nr:Fic family protein [Bacteroides fragilis]
MNREQKTLALLTQFKELGIDKQIDYDKFYLYSIITHSTAIEGSTITEIENQLLFDEGISAKGRSMTEQLMNLDLKAAYEQSIAFAKSHSDITVEMLKKLSSIVLKNPGTTYQTALGELSSANGDLRLLNVTAGTGGRSYMNYSKVPTKLAELCENINQRRKALSKANTIECYKLSFDVHFHLVTIHPWADGNGRMSRLLMNQLQFEYGIIPKNINKDRKAEYIEALIATRENDDIELFRNFMFDEHIRNLEQVIHNYQVSIEDEGLEPRADVGINVGTNVGINEQRTLELIRINNRITAKEVAESLSVSLRQGERIMATLKEKGLIERIGPNKSGYWEVKKWI